MPDQVPPDDALFTALVLAGRRGPRDPLALASGVSHKALIPIAGSPMLLRVLQTLEAARSVAGCRVCIDDPAALAAVPALAPLLAERRITFEPSAETPSASVLGCLDRLAPGPPLLVTTADHPLLTAPMVDYFCREALAHSADLVVGVVTRDTVRRGFPETRRTFIPLRGEGVTGANLFVLRTPHARRAVEFWRRAERLRKSPWRLVSLFGLGSLARFALRRLDLDAALERASQVMGARVEAVRLPFAECAIDVDRPDDLALASRVLAPGAPLEPWP